MGRMPWVTYLWPGLTALWRQGSWSALGLAAAFAALLNVAVVGTLLWSELFPPFWRSTVWLLVVVIWAFSAAVSCHCCQRSQRDGPAGDPFVRALDHYLKGNWFEVERGLTGLLIENPRDVEAGLLLATLFRHTGRFEEAARRLERTECFEASQKWEVEIRRERELLTEASGRQRGQPAEASAANSDNLPVGVPGAAEAGIRN